MVSIGKRGREIISPIALANPLPIGGQQQQNPLLFGSTSPALAPLALSAIGGGAGMASAILQRKEKASSTFFDSILPFLGHAGAAAAISPFPVSPFIRGAGVAAAGASFGINKLRGQ